MDNEQNKKDEPAFVVADKNTIFALGLTKREWFAATLDVGEIVDLERLTIEKYLEVLGEDEKPDGYSRMEAIELAARFMARCRGIYASAMLAELSAKEGK